MPRAIVWFKQKLQTVKAMATLSFVKAIVAQSFVKAIAAQSFVKAMVAQNFVKTMVIQNFQADMQDSYCHRTRVKCCFPLYIPQSDFLSCLNP